MADRNSHHEGDLDAGDFGPWLTGIQAAIRGEGTSDVPCGTCTACCTASQFIHIGPDETDTLAQIPAELLFPAPRSPRGHVLMGYDQHGHCPMLIDNTCSIYEHRPRTCRTYDCRIFPAAGVDLDDPEKILISERSTRWRFTFPTERDEILHQAVRAAAVHLRQRRDVPPDELPPANATQLAVLALKLHATFLEREDVT